MRPGSECKRALPVFETSPSTPRDRLRSEVDRRASPLYHPFVNERPRSAVEEAPNRNRTRRREKVHHAQQSRVPPHNANQLQVRGRVLKAIVPPQSTNHIRERGGIQDIVERSPPYYEPYSRERLRICKKLIVNRILTITMILALTMM